MPIIEEVVIRPVRHEDVGGFHDCLDAVAGERRFLMQVEAPGSELVRSFVVGNIENGLPQFVAVDGSVVVGWCDVIPRPFEGVRHVGVLGMGVLPAYRGRGLGRRLAEQTIAAAHAIGVTRVELEVFVSNEGAVRLYERLGFEVEGRKRRARILDGRCEDILCMARLFDEVHEDGGKAASP